MAPTAGQRSRCRARRLPFDARRPASRRPRTSTRSHRTSSWAARPQMRRDEQLPILQDDAVTSYVETVGHRLVDAIPAEPATSEFKYTFETVNVREINAFALPGGPMFVNRGMIEAAQPEGEVAGVMAHEISHVRAASRDGAGEQGHQVRDRTAARGDCRGHRRRRGRQRRSRRARSSVSAPRSCATAASTRSRPTSRARRSWRAPATTRAKWPTCSRRSRSRAGRTVPSG